MSLASGQVIDQYLGNGDPEDEGQVDDALSIEAQTDETGAINHDPVVTGRRHRRTMPGQVLFVSSGVLTALGLADPTAMTFAIAGWVLIFAEVCLSRLRMRTLRLRPIHLPTLLDIDVDNPIRLDLDGPEDLVVEVETVGSMQSLVYLTGVEGPARLGVSAGRSLVRQVSFKVTGGSVIGFGQHQIDFSQKLRRPLPVVPPALPAPELIQITDELTAGGAELELVGVRAYQPGDKPSDIHWPSVARAGETLVRERRSAGTSPDVVTIVAQAKTDDALIKVLGQARWAVERLWAGGIPTRLVVKDGQDANQAQTLDINDELNLGVKLVAARPGAFVPPVVNGPTIHVTERGIRWR